MRLVPTRSKICCAATLTALLLAVYFAAAPTLRSAPADDADGGTHTVIEVRVISKRAKFVGTSMGGAHVTLRDALTGELLTEGTTQGSTGDTKRIMTAAPRQGDVMATADAASYTAELHLEKPRKIEVAATGPVAQQQSATSVSQTQWVVPGKHITEGDAWLLELRGLVVDVLEPPTHVKLQGTPREVKLSANVTMMCGCPIGPDLPWKPDEFEVRAILRRDGDRVGTVQMEYAGKASQFEGTVQVEKPGAYQVTVYAYEPANGNTGLDHVTFIVTE